MALTPKYLQECTDGIEKIFWELGTDILVDIAQRLKEAGKMTATTEYLNEKLREMGLQQKWINQLLAKVMNTTEQEVEKLMDESTHKSTRSTFDILEKAGYDTTGLEFGDQILKTTNALNGDLQNLTRTTGQLASNKLMKLYDQAYLQVSSGAYSLDQAVTNAVKKLTNEGIGQVEYPTGAHRTVEAAVKVAVRTAVAQNALACEKQVIDDLDINLIETSSHIGARPSHEVWQGRVFWVKHPEGNYANFYEATGYGTPTGLGGYNCRHQFYPYFPEFGQTYHPIPHEINDAAYKAEQQQRAYERKLREWDRKEKILKAGGQDTTEARRWKNYYKGQIQKLVDQSKGFLKRDYAAERSYGNNVEKDETKERKNGSVDKTAKGRISMRKSYQEYTDYVKTKYSALKKETGNTKQDWIKILEKANFNSAYTITRTPELLKKYDIDSEIIMSLPNLAYIMWRHAKEYDENVLLSIKDVIDDYDLLMEGEREGTRDYKFYKLYREPNSTKEYGIEVAIDRPADSGDEFVVHVNYLGSKNKKGIKHFRKLKKKWVLIDEKNRL